MTLPDTINPYNPSQNSIISAQSSCAQCSARLEATLRRPCATTRRRKECRESHRLPVLVALSTSAAALGPGISRQCVLAGVGPGSRVMQAVHPPLRRAREGASDRFGDLLRPNSPLLVAVSSI